MGAGPARAQLRFHAQERPRRDRHGRLARPRPRAIARPRRPRLRPRDRRPRPGRARARPRRPRRPHARRRDRRRRHGPRPPRRPRRRRRRADRPPRQQRQPPRPEPAAAASRLPARRARARVRDERDRPARARPARPATHGRGRDDPQHQLRRGGRAVRGLGRIRLVQGPARAAHACAGRRAPAAAHPRRRPRRHAHADAPGRLPRRGHLRPPAARGERPGLPRAHRGRARERAVPRARRRAGRAVTAPAFTLPERLEAHEPPEARGLERDEVRMLVTERASGRVLDLRARDLPDALAPGYLLVVNTSATLPAAVPATRPDGTSVDLHVSTALPGAEAHRLVELRRDGARFGGGRAGELLDLPGGATATLVAPSVGARRLWVADLELPAPLEPYLARHGRPIRYRHVRGDWPLAAYQTVYATEPGSAEMPSAGRPLSDRAITRLVARGIAVAPIVLHAGVSSLEGGETPGPERFRVPEATARLVRATRAGGGRVVAVGTTVVRALETAADEGGGEVVASEGWTRLVVTPEHGVRAVDGLLTGWHEPESSHLQLLRAVGGARLVARAYREALERAYLWHEFGDVHLILP